MGIAALSPWWGIGIMLLLGGVVAGGCLWQRDRSRRRFQVEALVRGLCDLNARVASDPELAALLIAFTESPSDLTRVERVRARAWFDSARRLHRLLHAALDSPAHRNFPRAMWAPSMGEAVASGAGPRSSYSAARSSSPAPDSDYEGVSNLTLVDPEFMAWAEAVREERGG